MKFLEWFQKGERGLFAGVFLVIAVVAALLFLTARCDGDDGSEQVEHSKASAEAISDAAKNAIEVVQTQAATEANINAAVEMTKGEIKDAKSVEAIRASVVAGLCGRPAFANDPACRVR